MYDEIQRKIDLRMHEPPPPGSRLPGWVGAALLSAGLALPAMAGCCLTDGPANVYAGPPVRDPESRPQPPPDEPAGKKGAPAATPEEPMRPETVPIYGTRG